MMSVGRNRKAAKQRYRIGPTISRKKESEYHGITIRMDYSPWPRCLGTISAYHGDGSRRIYSGVCRDL